MNANQRARLEIKGLRDEMKETTELWKELDGAVEKFVRDRERARRQVDRFAVATALILWPVLFYCCFRYTY